MCVTRAGSWNAGDVKREREHDRQRDRDDQQNER